MHSSRGEHYVNAFEGAKKVIAGEVEPVEF